MRLPEAQQAVRFAEQDSHRHSVLQHAEIPFQVFVRELAPVSTGHPGLNMEA